MTGMNAQSLSPEALPQTCATGADVSPATTVEIDRSCCAPLTLLFCSAAFWSMIGLLLGAISSIKLHAPAFLGDMAWFTYGRIYPASLNLLVYGFASQAGLGILLWLFARLGRVTLQRPGIVIAGGLFWNLGVTLGVLGILSGQNTGYEWLEMPQYAAVMLFAGYVLVGISALMTFHSRRECGLYVSQWFLLAALFWFPWIYSTAELLLVFGSVRGTFQEVVNGWFTHNLFFLWLTPVGLAAIFYFIPKILNRPLHSHHLAMFGFWAFALFGSWGGLYAGQPIPKWMPTLCIAAAVMMIIPLLATATNWYLTVAQDRGRVLEEPALIFVLFAASTYLLLSALEIVASFRSVSSVTLFTLYGFGLTQLRICGFMGMLVAGAIYYIMPRITQCEWPDLKLIRVHFWLAAVGVGLTALALVIGGVIQGFRTQDPSVPFLNVVRSTVPFLGLSTLGGLLLIGSNVSLLVNLGKLLRECGCCRVGSPLAPIGPNSRSPGGKR
jgi:cytochrome c oxidase cbb3-type subunit I